MLTCPARDRARATHPDGRRDASRPSRPGRRAAAAHDCRRTLRMRRPLGLMPRSTSTLISRPAMPETVAVAKLVPVARHRPPPTQAPGTLLPGAMMPCVRWPGPQLLDSSGAAGVVVRADREHAGHRGRNGVAGAALVAGGGHHQHIGGRRRPARPAQVVARADSRSACCEALILMMLACRSRALRMPAAKSSCVQICCGSGGRRRSGWRWWCSPAQCPARRRRPNRR